MLLLLSTITRKIVKNLFLPIITSEVKQGTVLAILTYVGLIMPVTSFFRVYISTPWIFIQLTILIMAIPSDLETQNKLWRGVLDVQCCQDDLSGLENL